MIYHWAILTPDDRRLIGWREILVKPGEMPPEFTKDDVVFFDKPDNRTDGRYLWNPDKQTFEPDHAFLVKKGDTKIRNQQAAAVLAGWIPKEEVSKEVRDFVEFIEQSDPQYAKQVRERMTPVKRPAGV